MRARTGTNSATPLLQLSHSFSAGKDLVKSGGKKHIESRKMTHGSVVGQLHLFPMLLDFTLKSFQQLKSKVTKDLRLCSDKHYCGLLKQKLN